MVATTGLDASKGPNATGDSPAQASRCGSGLQTPDSARCTAERGWMGRQKLPRPAWFPESQEGLIRQASEVGSALAKGWTRKVGRGATRRASLRGCDFRGLSSPWTEELCPGVSSNSFPRGFSTLRLLPTPQ